MSKTKYINNKFYNYATNINKTMVEIMELILQGQYPQAQDLFNLLPVPAQYNVEYELIKTRIHCEFNINDDEYIDELLLALLYPNDSDEGFLVVLLELMQLESWGLLDKYINIAMPFKDFFGPVEEGVFMIYMLIIDFHMYEECSSARIVDDFIMITFTDAWEYFIFLDYASGLGQIIDPSSSLADNIASAIYNVDYESDVA